ncbi:MAG: hypothetical protein J6B92_08180 [Paraprevotella sp.]|nr:hypothetical protein [Paraprevotella sp.]
MKKVYFNDFQQEVMFTGAKDNVLVGGRGIGKGVVQASINLRNVQHMPRSSSAAVAPNAKRALTNTLPSMLQHWERWGYKRDIHWCIGHRPAKSWHWPKPIFEPNCYDNVISTYTGAIIFIVSQDRKGTSNSMSYDYVTVDEAKFIDFEQLKDETLPANRGQQADFGHLPYHHGMTITSDMPVTKRGSWFLAYRDKYNPEIIALIQGMATELWHQKKRREAGQGDMASIDREIRRLERALSRFRAHALFYKEFSSFVNYQVLGESFLRQMKRDLPPLTYQTSILCRRISVLKDGFYSSLRAANKYNAADLHYLDGLDYDLSRLSDPDSRMDADVCPDEPLCIAFDFNANINWLVCGQPDWEEGSLRVLKSFYVKYERKLPELCEDFDHYYRFHRNREIIFYFDSTALGSNYAVNNEDFKWVVCSKFERMGWMVRPVYIGAPMPHVDKHLLINRMLAGQARLRPLINETNNEDLLISIQTAGVYNGGKDKRGEKLAETEDDRLEGRTDGSDAFDNLCIGCERFPQRLWLYPVTSDM